MARNRGRHRRSASLTGWPATSKNTPARLELTCRWTPISLAFGSSLPRPLFLNTGSEDRWGDPHGEFLAARAATPVYELLGKTGNLDTEFPPLDRALQHDIGFNSHTGKHDDAAHFGLGQFPGFRRPPFQEMIR